jgi:transcription initiation factor TFIID subunit TAF12
VRASAAADPAIASAHRDKELRDHKDADELVVELQKLLQVLQGGLHCVEGACQEAFEGGANGPRADGAAEAVDSSMAVEQAVAQPQQPQQPQQQPQQPQQPQQQQQQ